MALKERYDFANLHNMMEEGVLTELERQLEAIADEDLCKCNDCVLDMACFSLNSLTPKYRSSLMGGIYARAELDEHEEQVRQAVSSAIERVSQNPLCENFR
ncbi:MAG: late competence development ComFB family protein [Spirochaetales bacterium]|nr:late competence development ComFB family protein [Spirochaetales bacterium]